jgi:di/tricarboxylate transporter
MVDIVVSASAAAVVMVAVGILTEQEARNAVKWDVLMSIGCAFGISTAIVNSGTAELIGNLLLDVGKALGMGNFGLISAVYFATFMTSSVVATNAAAAMMFPIAMYSADRYGTDRVIMSYAVVFGDSASFMTPFSYQCNLIIFGPGGYTTSDFLRFGTPLQIVLWIATSVFLSLENWLHGWIYTVVGLTMIVVAKTGVKAVMKHQGTFSSFLNSER